ncbi:hypothetical protein GCM10009682_05720 [Luedemannella flava]|uniref:Integral membrane protein n=2 Tax=Luedemannella flava TaxID=349316 RepID=A0ABN2LFL3_9ACTN
MPLPFRMLGWVAGALSMVNLVRDLDWVSLRGSVDQWVDAYGRFVAAGADLLFGWIKVGWLHVSHMEAHGLVIVGLLLSTFIKAGVTETNARGQAATFGEDVVKPLGALGVPAVAAALVLPGSWGFWVPVVGMTSFCTLAFFMGAEMGRTFKVAVLTNLAGTLGIAALVVLLGSALR